MSTRCRSDSDTNLATLDDFTYPGTYADGTQRPADFYKIFGKAGVSYTPRVSIGLNPNSFSSGAIRPRVAG